MPQRPTPLRPPRHTIRTAPPPPPNASARSHTNNSFCCPRMQALPYTYCYCEENVYRLLSETLGSDCPFDDAYAVVVSSYSCAPVAEKVNVWQSVVPYRPCRVANPARDATIWDYHVIALVGNKGAGKYYVVDFDSQLPRSGDVTVPRWKDVCVAFSRYVNETFLSLMHAGLALGGAPLAAVLDTVRFRVVTRGDYLCFLRTDRAHMRDASGNYNSPPPPYEAIQDFHPSTSDAAKRRYNEVMGMFSPEHKRNNLVSFINTLNDSFPGDVLGVNDFISRFS